MAGLEVFQKIIVFTLWISLINTLSNAEIHRLNVPRVLLPVFHDFPVNFTLEVSEDGCYQWSTSRPDIIRLIPTNEHYDYTCSSSVIVQTVTREATRSTAIVLAEDTDSGHFLRCDVIVDAISSLNMVTTTRELFIEEAPEAFEVRAYDEQGNEFTTLAGIEFAWSINNTNKQGSQVDSSFESILRFMTFEESPYETPNTVAMLDKMGKMGHIVLMEGVKTGTTKISVRLMNEEYKHVPPVEVELVVVANLIIIPANVTVMAHDSFKYKIMQVHQGRLEEIKLPSNQYYLKAEIQEVLEINNDYGSAYALMLGRTKVLLHDKNVNEDYGVILPTAEVCVSDVSYITIAILPHRSRALILGQTHEITMEFYNSKDHKFYIGDNVDAAMKISGQYFDEIMTTKNGTHSIVVPINTGVTVVEATLYGVIDQNGRRILLPQKLTTKAELTIHSPVHVQPRILTLPWDPKGSIKFDVALKASGGDGSYIWNSRQQSIVTVSANGVVKILQQGSADVIVSMARNPYNRDLARVHVLPPSKLQITQYNMEAAVGEQIYLHIALFGKITDGSNDKEMAFNDCRNLPFEVYIPERNFVLNNSDVSQQPVGTACATLAIVSQSVGTAVVTVAYNANGQYFMDNVTVSAYEPLTAVHPANAETVLAVGSSRKLIFKGGPHPWSGKLQGYQREISIDNENIVQVSAYKITDDHERVSVFDVLCKSLGESVVKFTVSNIPILPNCKKNDAVANVHIICAKPRYIYLQPEFKDAKNCPLTQNADRVIAHYDKIVEFTVIVKDEDGKRFDNISSLSVEWTLKPSTGGTIQVPVGVLDETFTEFQVVLPKRHYQRIQPNKKTESLLLRAKVSGYQKSVMSKLKISPEWPPFYIEGEKGFLETPLIEAILTISLVNDTVIIPNNLKILNNPNSKHELQVSQGSGYVEMFLTTNDIADVRYVEPTKTLSIIPKKSGTLHIVLTDLCLPSSEAAKAVIEVQQLASLEVDTLTKVEVGKYITATVKLYDTNGYLIKLPSLNSVNMTMEIENGFVEVMPEDEQVNSGLSVYDHLRYSILGLEEGETQLVFRNVEYMVESESILIQVFPPLKVMPKNLTALVGTCYQIHVTGGPKNAEIEYFLEDDHNQVLSIDRHGILEGKSVGQAKIVAKAVGVDAKGNKVIYSQDNIVVHVTVLEGVKIVVPTNRIKVGATIPVWAFGIPDHLTPLLIGSMKTPLVFSWSIDQPDIVRLQNMYEGTGINTRNLNEITLRAKALKPGLLTIFLNVTVPCHVSSGCKYAKVHSASVKIDIFEELRLLSNDHYFGLPVILMAPNSVLKLKTNRDKSGGVTTYKIMSNGQVIESDDPHALTSITKSVTIDKNGVVRSGEIIGKTVLFITHVETYGFKHSLSVIIDVKPIHYMMLSLKSNIRLRSGEELTMLPKGMELKYIVEYFDNVGSKFHGAEVDIKAIYNRGDSIDLSYEEENSISVKFIDNGDLIVKIFNEKYPNSMFDYVHMLIGDILFPTKTSIIVGDIVCFSMPLLSSDGNPGYWKSSAPDILSIDPVTGIGQARSPGQTYVTQSLTSHLQRELEVNVDPITTISLVLLRGKNITGMETFSIPLILKGKDEHIKENNVLSRGLGGCRTLSSFSLSSYPFTCSIQFVKQYTHITIKELFLAKPRFDIVSGFYFCDIIPISLPTITTSVLETYVKINAMSRDIESNFIEIAYLPPVYISTKEIVFVSSPSNIVSSATLDVYGLPQVLDQLMIDAPEDITIGERVESKNFIQYKLSLIRYNDEIQGQKIVVTNDLTKQNISLYIRISKYEHCANVSSIPWLEQLYVYRYVIITVIVVCISFFHYWRTRIASIELTVKNRSVFADKCPPPMKKSSTPCTPNTTLNSSMNTPTTHSPNSSFRPFSTFEPVYGDPRGFYTPNARRNKSLHGP